MIKKISNKLLPCPFCGSGAFFDTYDITDFKSYLKNEIRYGILVICSNKNCAACMTGVSKKDAQKAWNRRISKRSICLTSKEVTA